MLKNITATINCVINVLKSKNAKYDFEQKINCIAPCIAQTPKIIIINLVSLSHIMIALMEITNATNRISKFGYIVKNPTL